MQQRALVQLRFECQWIVLHQIGRLQLTLCETVL